MKSALTPAPPPPTPETSFRRRLQAELAERCATNPRYSLRAFAKKLDVDHSTLSQILRGVRPLTAPAIVRLGEKLGLDATRIAAYVEHERHRPAGADEVRRLAQDALATLAEPHHAAILELVRLDAFQPDFRWIGRQLDLPVDEVAMAVQRLLRLGLLAMAAPDRWVDTTGHAVADLDAFPDATLAHLFARLREAAGKAARRPAAERALATTTIAVDRRRLPEVRERIAAFRRELLALLEGDPSRDAVYQLDVAFYPLTAAPNPQPSEETAPWADP